MKANHINGYGVTVKMCIVDFGVALLISPAERCSRTEFNKCRLPSLLPRTRRCRRLCTPARTWKHKEMKNQKVNRRVAAYVSPFINFINRRTAADGQKVSERTQLGRKRKQVLRQHVVASVLKSHKKSRMNHLINRASNLVAILRWNRLEINIMRIGVDAGWGLDICRCNRKIRIKYSELLLDPIII